MIESESVSTVVLEKIAKREGVEPSELDAPLYDVIDGEALDGLVESARAGHTQRFELTFSYYGYLVTIDESGDVQVTDGVQADSNDASAMG